MYPYEYLHLSVHVSICLSIYLSIYQPNKNIINNPPLNRTSTRRNKQLKRRFIKTEQIDYKPITKPINWTTKTSTRKLPDILHHRSRPATKYWNNKHYKIYSTNHANIKTLFFLSRFSLTTIPESQDCRRRGRACL